MTRLGAMRRATGSLSQQGALWIRVRFSLSSLAAVPRHMWHCSPISSCAAWTALHVSILEFTTSGKGATSWRRSNDFED